MDYSMVVGTMFHPDAFNASDNMSWWCGDPQLSGYDNHWLQYLDTPIIDLSSTTNPLLFDWCPGALRWLGWMQCLDINRWRQQFPARLPDEPCLYLSKPMELRAS